MTTKQKPLKLSALYLGKPYMVTEHRHDPSRFADYDVSADICAFTGYNSENHAKRMGASYIRGIATNDGSKSQYDAHQSITNLSELEDYINVFNNHPYTKDSDELMIRHDLGFISLGKSDKALDAAKAILSALEKKGLDATPDNFMSCALFNDELDSIIPRKTVSLREIQYNHSPHQDTYGFRVVLTPRKSMMASVTDVKWQNGRGELFADYQAGKGLTVHRDYIDFKINKHEPLFWISAPSKPDQSILSIKEIEMLTKGGVNTSIVSPEDIDRLLRDALTTRVTNISDPTTSIKYCRPTNCPAPKTLPDINLKLMSIAVLDNYKKNPQMELPLPDVPYLKEHKELARQKIVRHMSKEINKEKSNDLSL